MKTSRAKFWKTLKEIRGFKVLKNEGWVIRKHVGYYGSLCPVTAVAKELTGRDHALDEVEAADDIGLDGDFAVAIANAADYAEENLSFQKEKTLRRKLLKACGIVDKPAKKNK